MPNPIKVGKAVVKGITAGKKRAANKVTKPSAGMNRARGLLQGQTKGRNELGWGENSKIRNGTRDAGSKPTLVKGMPGTDMLNTKVSVSNKSLA